MARSDPDLIKIDQIWSKRSQKPPFKAVFGGPGQYPCESAGHFPRPTKTGITTCSFWPKFGPFWAGPSSKCPKTTRNETIRRSGSNLRFEPDLLPCSYCTFSAVSQQNHMKFYLSWSGVWRGRRRLGRAVWWRRTQISSMTIPRPLSAKSPNLGQWTLSELTSRTPWRPPLPSLQTREVWSFKKSWKSILPPPRAGQKPPENQRQSVLFPTSAL